ncbi:MAG TPA: enoyl-CoA hydratase-related protein [Acidimicrobiales bacterium]|nr:enoyl-CoA hydratase-related protein [Acidimicrobiales bacterium]
MAEASVFLERRPDGVALVRLDRPKANALSLDLLGQLASVAAQLAGQPPKAVVVWGGPRIFSAGAEVSELTGPEAGRRVSEAFQAALDPLAALPRATVAAICGPALGGGLELALACDFRVCADTARLGQPEVLLGIMPGGGATQRLPRLVGPARAKELVMTGRQVGAEEAARIGLVDRVVPAAKVLEEALGWAAQLAAGAVVAQGLAKAAIDASAGLGPSEGLALERDSFVASLATEDARAGIESFHRHGPGRASFVGR